MENKRVRVLFTVTICMAVLICGAVLLYNNNRVGNKEEDASVDVLLETKTYTMEEVGVHNSAENCWMAIEGKVYDVTSFVTSHPGGKSIIGGCGKDATILFNERPTNNKGQHPIQAQRMLTEYYIGDLILKQSENETVSKIEKKVFGVSTNNRPIEGYVMGSGENTIFLFSAIHGDEKNTTELLNEFVQEIQSNQELIHESKKIVVMPIANPDGYFERTDNLNTNEVNLNRNFETAKWDKYDPNGSFAGVKPFSEPESKVIQQVVEEYEPDIMIAFHAQGGVIAPEEDSASIALANWYGEKTGYTYYGEWQYTGTATGWFLETRQKPSITVELSNHEESDWDINREALLALVSSEHISFK
jgi:cytochrome b involved in lipid metabolism